MADRVRSPQPANRRFAPSDPLPAQDPSSTTVPPPELSSVPQQFTSSEGLQQDLGYGQQTFPGGIQVPDPHAPPTAQRMIDPLLIPRPVLTANGLNLLPNGNFESSNPTVNAAPPGYTLGTNTNLFWKNTNQRSGNWCAQVTDAFSSATYSISATHNVQGGFPYRFQAYIQATNNVTTWQVVIQWLDSMGNLISTYTSPNTTLTLNTYVLVDSLPAVSPTNAVTATWTLQTTALVPAGDTHYIDDITFAATTGAQGDTVVTGSGGIRSQNYQTGVSGWAIDGRGNSEFNNMLLRGQLYGIDGPNLLTNPGAETASQFSPWWTAGTGGTLAQSSTQKHSGSWAFGFTSNNTNAVCDLQYAVDLNTTRLVPVVQGNVYRATGWVYSNQNSFVRQAQVYVAWYTSGGAFINNSSGTQETISQQSWYFVSGTFVPPSNAAYAQVNYRYWGTGGNIPNLETWYWDDVYFGSVSKGILGYMATGSAGERIELVSGGGNQINLYSGDSGEVTPNYLLTTVDRSSAERLRVDLEAGSFNASPMSLALVRLYGDANNGVSFSEIDVSARTVVLGDNNAAAKVQANAGTVDLKTNVGSAGVLLPEVYCDCNQGTAQSIPTGSLTAITMDTNTEVVPASMHSTSTNPSRVIAPVTGVYHVTGTVVFAVNSSGHQRIAGLRVNGATEIARQGIIPGTYANDFAWVNVSRLVKLNANDYVELMAQHDVGLPISTSPGANGPSLQMTLIQRTA